VRREHTQRRDAFSRPDQRQHLRRLEVEQVADHDHAPRPCEPRAREQLLHGTPPVRSELAHELDPAREIRARAQRPRLHGSRLAVHDEFARDTEPQRDKTDRQCHFRRSLQLRRAAEPHRATRVEQDRPVLAQFRAPHAHERLIRAREQFPVQVAQVLARAVRPVAFELDAAPGPPSQPEVLARPPRPRARRELLDPRQELRCEHDPTRVDAVLAPDLPRGHRR
jgi:hypothetical protein